ncbi:MAG: hypothetical protein WCL14_05620 [Bacteroidota bacterium]
MKNLILALVAICFAAIVTAQNATPAATTPAGKPATAVPASAKANPTPAVMFGCTKCDNVAPKEGKCPTHQVAMVKDHSYFCADGSVSEKAGKCADGKEMTMMDCKSKMMNARAKSAKEAKPATPASATPATAPAPVKK